MDAPPSTSRDGTSATALRSSSLRFIVLSILFANLAFGDGPVDSAVQLAIGAAYLTVTMASVVAALYYPRRRTYFVLFSALDALLVGVILYEHLLASPVTADHSLTTSSLVIPFILLNHVALSLDRRLVVLFSTLVVASWLSMLAVMAYRHLGATHGGLLSDFLSRDLGLTLSFAFTALAAYLLARDHDRTLRRAKRIEEKRMNLSRFFSPRVVADLQNASAMLDLERRPAAIMFVDIRDFTAYAEVAPAAELASVLSEYRRIVAGTVFSYGGTVDKFLGDGVMAVFGQPRPGVDDARLALECALALAASLKSWTESVRHAGGPQLMTGIGLHYGNVLGGVIESGFHDEFTVIGDAVNVAQRLETLAKTLKSPLVVSQRLLAEVPFLSSDEPWIFLDQAEIPGRRGALDIAFLPAVTPSRLEEAVAV